MSSFFDLSSPLVQRISRIGDIALLSIEWFIGCIPVVTAGAASCALYSAIHRSFSRKEGIAAAEFLKAFRQNFRQATLSFLPLGLAELLLLGECFLTEYLTEQGSPWGGLRPLFLVLACVDLLWMLYAAAYSARFQDTIPNTLRLSAILALSAPLRSIALMAVLCAAAFLLPVWPPLILCLPALCAWSAHALIEPVFSRFDQ